MTKIKQLAAITNPILTGGTGSAAAEAQSGSLFFSIISGILQFMMIIGALTALVNLIQAGLEWVGSGGDSSKLETSKNRITHAVIGLIILSASFAIWMLARDFLGIKMTISPLFP